MRELVRVEMKPGDEKPVTGKAQRTGADEQRAVLSLKMIVDVLGVWEQRNRCGSVEKWPPLANSIGTP